MGLTVHILKERKVTRVMGCALRRQLSVPGAGFSMVVADFERPIAFQSCYVSFIAVVGFVWLLNRLPHFLRSGSSRAEVKAAHVMVLARATSFAAAPALFQLPHHHYHLEDDPFRASTIPKLLAVGFDDVLMYAKMAAKTNRSMVMMWYGRMRHG